MSDETEAAAAALVTLRTRVDAHFDQAFERSAGGMTCAPGCEQCCHVDLSVFEIEAAPIRDALRALPPSLRQRVREASGQTERCAMLVDGRCAVYEQRPLICRSHGAPVLLEDGKVDHCPLNFTKSPPPAETVLNLAALNRPLSVMATMWDGRGARVSLRSLAATEDDA